MEISSARTKLKAFSLITLAIVSSSYLSTANAYHLICKKVEDTNQDSNDTSKGSASTYKSSTNTYQSSSDTYQSSTTTFKSSAATYKNNTDTYESSVSTYKSNSGHPLPQSRWYAGVGAEYYSVNLPSYRLPITFGHWVATNPPTLPPTGLDAGFNAADTTAGNTTILPFFSIGYNLKNGSTFLPEYLDQEAVEFDYAQFNRATKDMRIYTGATGVDAGAGYGVIWKIDDVSVPTYGGGALRIVDSFIHSSVHYHDADLFVKGNVKNLPSNLHSTVKAGVVLTGLDQYYAYNINATTQGSVHAPVNAFGDDSMRTRYAGFAIGDRIDFQFSPAFSWFVDATVQALYATTRLTANQTPDADASPLAAFADYNDNIRVAGSDNKFTYRAKASTGLSFYPKLFANANPLRISVYGGIDEWGYVPQEATVSAFGESTPHIAEHSMRNYFVGASLTMPIA